MNKEREKLSEIILGNIQKAGWSFVGEMSDGIRPPYGYTVGLHKTYGHPEIIIVGIPFGASSDIASKIEAMVEAGEAISTSKCYTNLLQRYDALFLRVGESYKREWLAWSNLIYPDYDMPVLQMIWPDTQNVMPWESGYEERFAQSQPLLSDTPFTPAARTQK